MPNSGTAGSYGSFIASFKEIFILFSIVAILIYIPINSAREFPFHHIPAFIVCRVFDHGHSDGYEVMPHCIFDLHFSNNEQC